MTKEDVEQIGKIMEGKLKQERENTERLLETGWKQTRAQLEQERENTKRLLKAEREQTKAELKAEREQTRAQLEQERAYTKGQFEAEREQTKQLLEPMQKQINHMNRKLNRIAKDLSYVIKTFDEDIVRTQKRVNHIEDHLENTPINGIAYERAEPYKPYSAH